MRPALGALAVLLCTCTTRDTRPTRAAPTQATLFFTSQLKGYLGPCGCSENMRGGLSRAAEQVKAARSTGTPVFLFDTGDALFASQTIPEPAVLQQERKARAMASGLTAMGLTARAVGPFDDARGAAFRETLGLPELTPGTVRWLEAGSARLAVFATPDVTQAQATAAKARAEGASFVVALCAQTFDLVLRQAIQAPDVDLFVAPPKDEAAAEENRLVGGSTKVAQVQTKGRSLFRVELVLRDEGRVSWVKGGAERERELATLDERIELLRAQIDQPGLDPALKALRQAKLEELFTRRQAVAEAPLPLPPEGNVGTFRFIPLEPSLPQEPTVRGIEIAYDRDVGELNLAWAKEHGHDCAAPTPEVPGFVGSAACVGCHPNAAKVFQTMKHAQAYASLEAQGKQHHLDCVPCHVTGWQQPGGVCRIDSTEGRREVGCEACHGPGSTHVKQPVRNLRREASATVCTGCHDHENSPHFDFGPYLERIRVPGHGLPALSASDGG